MAGEDLPGKPETDLDEWLKQVRDPAQPNLGQPPPPAPPPRPSRVVLLVPVFGLVLAWLLALSVDDPAALGPQTLRGTVSNQGLEGLGSALVFLESNPNILARTDADGGFVLGSVPAGEQVLVVVVAEIGQEFPIKVGGTSSGDVGVLVHAAPHAP
jgi:hypothetical protein